MNHRPFCLQKMSWEMRRGARNILDVSILSLKSDSINGRKRIHVKSIILWSLCIAFLSTGSIAMHEMETPEKTQPRKIRILISKTALNQKAENLNDKAELASNSSSI